MKPEIRNRFVFAVVLGIGVVFVASGSDEYLSGIVWPEPPVVTPAEPGQPPSDAIVLFDGKDLSAWQNGDKWIIQDGYATVKDTDITTKQEFGDCQLHIEWATPEKVRGSGQGRGNSGVFLMNRYELQILDSFDNKTYFDGQAGAIYKQQPPMVNASRGPGEWQTYDITFTAPRFDKDGSLLHPAVMTVFHNGVCIQNNTALQGATSFTEPPRYRPHSPKGPIRLQNHGDPVRFRNIWIRELKPIVGTKPEGK